MPVRHRVERCNLQLGTTHCTGDANEEGTRSRQGCFSSLYLDSNDIAGGLLRACVPCNDIDGGLLRACVPSNDIAGGLLRACVPCDISEDRGAVIVEQLGAELLVPVHVQQPRLRSIV